MQCQTASGYCFRRIWAADRILLQLQRRFACKQPGIIRHFEDDLNRLNQLRTARVVVGDRPQKIEQDIFQIQ